MAKGICSIEGCDGPVKGRGWCTMHYGRWQRGVELTAPVRARPLRPPIAPKGACSIEGCEREVLCRGWCELHYGRWRRHGDPLTDLRRGPEERFWAKVAVGSPDECWPWTAYRDPKGYGYMGNGSSGTIGVHRFAYELLVGPIPEGLEIHHLCGNPSCCNPAHMHPLSPGDHMRLHDPATARSAAMARRTTCKHGHPKAIYGRHNGRQWVCRECGRLQMQRRRAAKKRAL